MKMRIPLYVASPCGFSPEEGMYFYHNRLLPAIGASGEWEILDPWTLTDKKLIDAAMSAPYGYERRAAWKTLNHVIGANNEAAIARSKLVVAVLNGQEIDSGTASEIGFAAALNIPTIDYRNDSRLIGDEGAQINLQVEYWIYSRRGVIVSSLSDLGRELKLRAGA